MNKVRLKEFLTRWMAECPNARFKWDSVLFDNPSNIISSVAKFEDGYVDFAANKAGHNHYGAKVRIKDLPGSGEWIHALRFKKSLSSSDILIETLL